MTGKTANRWCFTWPAANISVGGKERAALVLNSRWNSGDTITVSFLDGDPAVQRKVQQAARGWLDAGLANLNFDFRKNTNDTLIRISFRHPGSWSVIGTTCRQIADKKQP